MPDTDDAEATVREEARKRLIQEAKAAGKLTQPNIVTIHAYGETEEFQYICMEYISGKTLAQVLKERGKIPVEEAVPIFQQILLALEAADQEGIVHRDIKPANIMITRHNQVKVMDFGIARLPSLSMTVTGMVLGNPLLHVPGADLGEEGGHPVRSFLAWSRHLRGGDRRASLRGGKHRDAHLQDHPGRSGPTQRRQPAGARFPRGRHHQGPGQGPGRPVSEPDGDAERPGETVPDLDGG